jgi:hypothetical protein
LNEYYIVGADMGLHEDLDDSPSFSELNIEEEAESIVEEEREREDVGRKKKIRRMLEERLERKRLKQEFEDELDGEFDWSDLDDK